MDAFHSFPQKLTRTISFVKERMRHPHVERGGGGSSLLALQSELSLDLLETWGSEGASCLWLVPCLSVHLDAWAALPCSAAGLFSRAALCPGSLGPKWLSGNLFLVRATALSNCSRVFILQFTDKKKGGKFQPFKKLFGKKKKKGSLLSQEESSGRQSHSPPSASNGTFSSDEETQENNLR